MPAPSDDVAGDPAGGPTGAVPAGRPADATAAAVASEAGELSVAERRRWTSTVVLGDGDTATVRMIERADADALREFHARQSQESVYRRYFSPKPFLSDADIERFTRVDPPDRAGLVAMRGDELLGWATYARWPGRADADCAFMVDDQHHGAGIATLLLEHLAAIAKTAGIRRFTAEVLAENRPMLTVFSRAGWPVERRIDSGVIEVDFDLAETTEFLDSVSRREQRADSRAMSRLLLPRSIAVIGASIRPGSLGELLWRNVSSSERVPAYPVNPRHDHIGGSPCWPTIGDVPHDVSLAIVAVPATALDATLRQCLAAHVRGAVVITTADDDPQLIRATIEEVRSAGLRVIGPSSMGVASPLPDVDLRASLVPEEIPCGNVALSVQSGGLGSSILRRAGDLGIGLSWFVSLGDRTDVSGNDLLQFWDDDEHTAVIGMYTENIGNPRRFARIARRVSRRRPVVAVRTGAAAIGPASGALYRHCGVIEVPTVSALLDCLRLLSSQPPPRGPRVAVICNARSPRVLADAALRTAGLDPVAVAGPDWRAAPDDYAAAIAAAEADPNVDALFVVHAPAVPDRIDPVLVALADALAPCRKPAVVVSLGAADGRLTPASVIPRFLFPEQAAAALGRAYSYARWLADESGDPAAPPPGIDDAVRDAVEQVLAAAVAAAPDRVVALDHTATSSVLAAYGVAMPVTRYVPAAEAAATADALGYPVAIKARHRHVGRTVGAGIALDLEDAADVRSAVERMQASLDEHADWVTVQQMIGPGVDLRVSLTTDPAIGPLVRVGTGGLPALPFDDATPARLVPIQAAALAGLLADSGATALLDAQDLGPAGFAELVERVGQLAADHEEIVAIELNPVVVNASGAQVTDATILVSSVTTTRSQVRRL